MIEVWNRHRKHPEGAIYVGRGTQWGNPFRVGIHGNREGVVQRFKDYAVGRAEGDPTWLLSLRGKHLLCSCRPLPCHADVLLILANT